MRKEAHIYFADHQFQLVGELDFSSVMAIYQKSLLHLCQCKSLTFNFNQLKSSNSAGLALMIEWMKYAKRHQKPIRFLHLPKDLLAIVKAAKMDDLITPFLENVC